MRILRVKYKDTVFYASLQDRMLHCLNKDLGLSSPVPLDEVGVLPPVVPTKVVCCALNYKRHAEEMGKPLPREPVFFLKPSSAVIGSGQAIQMPLTVGEVHYEGELAVILGKHCRNVSEDQAPEYIFGYACANDVTARELQRKDVQYARSKGFDTFCPIGPWIETEVANPRGLRLRTLVNGEARQDSNTADMIFGPHFLVSYVSRVMTLYPGDAILTGTPPGVGPMQPGDEVRVEVDQVGLLINRVEAAPQDLSADPESALQ